MYAEDNMHDGAFQLTRLYFVFFFFCYLHIAYLTFFGFFFYINEVSNVLFIGFGEIPEFTEGY